MFAVFAEVNVPSEVVNEGALQQAREGIEKVAVPQVREAGATAAYWLAPTDGRGVSVSIFDTEDEARRAAGMIKVGEPAGPMPEVTFRTVEVLEVMVHL